MPKRILLIQGHPDATKSHLCHALEEAYANGATEIGHDLWRVYVAELDFPILRSQYEWEKGQLPSALIDAQTAIKWAEHIVLFFPLWLGDMPALLKAFLEQVARPGFAFPSDVKNPLLHKELKGRSAHVVVTMGMPALVYRWYFRAHSLKSLERNILGFVGIGPIDKTLIGSVDTMNKASVEKWLTKLKELGVSGK